MANCIFCKIVEGELEAKIVAEDEQGIAFWDMHPQAPTHILVIPRQHVSSLAEAGEGQKGLLGHLLLMAAQVAREQGLDPGYRVVINTGTEAGQTVFHLHLHLLGGRRLSWPPG